MVDDQAVETLTRHRAQLQLPHSNALRLGCHYRRETQGGKPRVVETGPATASITTSATTSTPAPAGPPTCSAVDWKCSTTLTTADEQDEILDKYDVERFNSVHLWLGVNFTEEEDYMKYFEIDYSSDYEIDDPQYPVCQFCTDIGERWYDEDFWHDPTQIHTG